MANYASAIFIVFLASVAYGEKIAIREELTVSIFHPMQLIQGWLRAKLDTRLLRNDRVPLVEFDWFPFENFDRKTNETKLKMEKQKKAYDALNDGDFKNASEGRRVFNNWYNVIGKLEQEYIICSEQGKLAKAMVTREEEKNKQLLERLKELSDELERCIANSGIIGFFKAIICTIKLSISILLNTVAVPNMPLRKYSSAREIMINESLAALPCPPPMLKSKEYWDAFCLGDIIAAATGTPQKGPTRLFDGGNYLSDGKNHCYPKCDQDADCRNDEACRDKLCGDLCKNHICASTATCEVISHKAKCSCPPGKIGDGWDECYTAIPTMTPGRNCDPETGARQLNSAFEAEPFEPRPIFDVIGNCTRSQLVKIREQYEKIYNASFSDRVNAELAPYYGLFFVPLPLAIANELVYKIDYLLDENFWIVLNNTEIQEVTKAYENVNSGSSLSLSDAVAEDINDDVRRSIFIAQFGGRRSEDPEVNEESASKDEEKISAEEKRHQWTSVDSRFHDVLTTRSYPQLRRISQLYRSRHERTLQESISDELSGKAADAYNDILTYAEEGKVGFFAEKLKKLIATGFPYPIDQMIMWRAEIDFGNIKKKYEEIAPDRPLEEFLELYLESADDREMWLARAGF